MTLWFKLSVARGGATIADIRTPHTAQHQLACITMLRLTAFVTSAVCCTSFLVPTTVPTHRSLLKIRHSGDHIMGSKHDPVRHPYMSSDAPPSYSSDQPVNRRKLLTDTIPAALAIGALGVAGAVTAGPERAFSVAPAPAAKPAPPGSKLVVLGGNGFVGSRVCEILVAAGESLVG